MALRRRKITAEFSMASMTDMIFLLLLFFMLTSTAFVPNAVKITLPQSSRHASVQPMTRVTIDAGLNYHVACGNEAERAASLADIMPFLRECYERDPDMYVALYADESVPYKEIVKILDVAARNNFRMVLITRPQ
jgi:biopolymer transport protein ExbD